MAQEAATRSGSGLGEAGAAPARVRGEGWLRLQSSRARWARRLVRVVTLGTTIVLLEAVILTIGLSYRVAANYTQPSRQAILGNPADYGLDHENVTLQTADGLALAGWYVPSRNRAALVLIHGIGTNRADLLPLGRDLAQLGFGLLLFDLRAHGESEGSASTLGLRETLDVRSAVDYLHSRADVRPDRIGVYGNSLGAAVAIMAAAELGDLRSVVADSGFASVEWVVSNQFNSLVRLPGWTAPLVLAFGRWQAGVDPGQVSPVERIHRISPRPILLVHGDRDATFAIQNAYLLSEAAGDPKELWIVPGVRHSGAYAVDPERYVERVGGFFQRSLLQ